MSVDLTLQQTNTSGRLMPALLGEALARLATGSTRASSIHGAIRGQELRLGLALSPTDPASAAFMLEFGRQGLRVNGTAHGPSAALLTWSFHALARALDCTLIDGSDGASGQAIGVDPERYHEAAVAYLVDYERQVRRTRDRRASGDDEAGEPEAATFLAWLAREEDIALSDDAGSVAELAAALPMDDAPALYEMLLDNDAVDDVFFSERQLASALERFLARDTLRRGKP